MTARTDLPPLFVKLSIAEYEYLIAMIGVAFAGCAVMNGGPNASEAELVKTGRQLGAMARSARDIGESLGDRGQTRLLMRLSTDAVRTWGEELRVSIAELEKPPMRTSGMIE